MLDGKFGFVYDPDNEYEVCILFGTLLPYIGEALRELGFSVSECYIEEFSGSFPDCILSIDGRKLRVEFELYSYNFREHGHSTEKCDLIVCWKHDWYSCPERVKVLDLFTVVSKLANERGLRIMLKERPTHKGRWSIPEFLDKLKENISETDYQQLKAFIDEIRSMRGIDIQTGKGTKVPTIGIGSIKLGNIYPLAIEATGKAYIAYFNVNVKPPQPIIEEKKTKEIRELLNEHEKMWHYIRTSSTGDLLDKMRKIIGVLLYP